jgi:chitinase
MFGPASSSSSVKRPFGSAVIDGFDFDFEATTQNMVPFAQQLRSLMDSDGSRKYYLSAAPQCVYPDAAMNEMLAGAVSFDFIMVQFYNNYCGVQNFSPGSSTQNAFNFATWDNWAKTVSKNRAVKVLLGIPANTGAAGSGYTPAGNLAPIIQYCQQFSSFGGVMMWDMSQLYANSGYMDAVSNALGGSPPPPSNTGSPPPSSTSQPPPSSTGSSPPGTTLTTVTTRPTTTAPTTTAPGSTPPTQTTSQPPTQTGSVPQWGQCGGIGYTGPTQCLPPYTCTSSGPYWSQCQ